MSEKSDAIGIFDSGFGGLSVMRAIYERMPHEHILYFGDTAHLPYGNKSQETILRYCLDNASFLATKQIKLLVIACNTACCAALDAIRHLLPIPVIGITEQGIAEVERLVKGGTVGILGTRATIASGLYQRKLLENVPARQLFSIACPLFVPLVEEGYIDHPMSHMIAQEYLSPLKHHALDGVLLGCTHYPMLASVIQAVLGPHVRLIDPAKACSEKTFETLQEQGLLNPSLEPPCHRFFASDDPEKFRLIGQALLKHPMSHVSGV